MCIHHIIFHTPCGHYVKNTRLCVQDHCPDVDRALRYYHDQPDYVLADGMLANQYDIPPSDQLRCPTACPEKWPPYIYSPNELEKAEYQAWVDQSVVIKHAHWNQHQGQSKAQAFQDRLDNISGKTRRAAVAQRNKQAPNSNVPKVHNTKDRYTKAEYPMHQLSHLIRMERAQFAPHTHPRWNVIVYEVAYGCGLHMEFACTLGHTPAARSQPQCPYLLAARMQEVKDPNAVEKEMLADMRTEMRGGAANSGFRHGDQESTKTAVTFDGYGGVTLEMLDDELLEAVFTVGKGPGLCLWHGKGSAVGKEMGRL